MAQESTKRTSNAAAEKGTESASGESTSPRQAAEDVVREAGAQAAEVKERVVEETSRAKEELGETASGVFTDFRAAIAEQIGRLAEALRGTGRQMHEHELGEIGAYPERLADGVDEVSSYLRDTPGRELRRDFERAVASNPPVMLGGLALIGAATAIYLKKEKSGEIRKRMDDMRERVGDMGRKGKQAAAEAVKGSEGDAHRGNAGSGPEGSDTARDRDRSVQGKSGGGESGRRGGG